jgi:hypothetical protein
LSGFGRSVILASLNDLTVLLLFPNIKSLWRLLEIFVNLYVTGAKCCDSDKK